MYFSQALLIAIASEIVSAGPYLKHGQLISRDYDYYDIPTGSAIVAGTNDLLDTALKVSQDSHKKSKTDKNTLNWAYLCPMAGELTDSIKEAEEMIRDGLKQEKLSSGLKDSLKKLADKSDKYVADLQQNGVRCNKADQLAEKTDRIKRLMDVKAPTSSKQSSKQRQDDPDTDSDDDSDDADGDDMFDKRSMSDVDAFLKGVGSYDYAAVEKRDGSGFPKFEDSVGADLFGTVIEKRDDDDDDDDSDDNDDDRRRSQADMRAVSQAAAKSLKTLQSTADKHYKDKGLNRNKYDDKFLCEYTDTLQDVAETIYKIERRGNKAKNNKDLKNAADDWVKYAKDKKVNCNNKLNKLNNYAKRLS